MAKEKYTSKNGNEYSVRGGKYTGYSFTNGNGEKSILGFDNQSEVKSYIEDRENGKAHFMDKLSDIKQN
jgi:hypothetical protein